MAMKLPESDGSELVVYWVAEFTYAALLKSR